MNLPLDYDICKVDGVVYKNTLAKRNVMPEL